MFLAVHICMSVPNSLIDAYINRVSFEIPGSDLIIKGSRLILQDFAHLLDVMKAPPRPLCHFYHLLQSKSNV